MIFGKTGEPKLSAPIRLLLFGRGFLSISPFIAMVPLRLHQNASRKGGNTFMLNIMHTQKLLSPHQRIDNLRWQMTYEGQQSRRQQTCRTCFCIVAFDISKSVLHLELTSSPSPGRAECRTGHICPAPGSARRIYPYISKQASLNISSPNGYSSMVPCTGKLAVCLGAVRMQHLVRCAASKTHARSH